MFDLALKMEHQIFVHDVDAQTSTSELPLTEMYRQKDAQNILG